MTTCSTSCTNQPGHFRARVISRWLGTASVVRGASTQRFVILAHPTLTPQSVQSFSLSYSLCWVSPFHRNLLVFSFSTCKWGRRLLGHLWEGLGELCKKGAVTDQMPAAASGIKLAGEGLALSLQHLLGTSSQVNWHSTCNLVPLCLRASPAQWGWWRSSGYMSVER